MIFMYHVLTITYLDSGQIHRFFNDVMVVMQLERFRIDWLIERPRVTLQA